MTWTNKEIPADEVMTTSNWRGYMFFHKLTKEQHKSLCSLLNFLCDKWDIKKTLTRNFNPALIKKDNYSGICLHSSFHPDKTDFHPELIDKIVL